MPDHRKHHIQPVSQIGGIVFVSIFILVGYLINIIPQWFLIGSIISSILGVLDDNADIRWQFKLFVELVLVAFLAYTFWGQFTHLSFYGYTIAVSQPVLLSVFTIWFVGIYNSVNLIDGLDGLAGGFMVLLCLGTSLLYSGVFSQVNLFLAVLLLVFLVFNQRPAKVFMGDAGSLFLGFYVAVLPLLNQNLSEQISTTLEMTPFVILVSYLVADTTRVFFTRLLSGKDPMNADTIHFHHLVIQRSGSYLTTLFIIYFVTLISALFAILSRSFVFDQTDMIVHLALVFLFVLTPPAPTYVSFISKLVKPAYTWHKQPINVQHQWPRTVLVAGLLFLLIGSLLMILNYSSIVNWQLLLSIILLALFIYFNRRDRMIIPVLQLFVCLFFLKATWAIELGIFSMLYTVLLLIALVIFTVQRVTGTVINHYSTLDLLVFFITSGALFLSMFGIILNPWIFLALFAVWFSIGFILRRTIYFKLFSSGT